MDSRKIAIVYDWIDSWGGVERLLLTLSEIYPQAVFFTSVFNPKKALWAKDLPVITSFIQRLPRFIRESRGLSLFFYPFAFESFNFQGYDLVISVSSSFAKGVITLPKTRHISYVLTPPRFLWGMTEDYLPNKLLHFFLLPFLNHLRKWDLVAANRPDKVYAISQAVAARCKKYYRLEAQVQYPPFDAHYWETIEKEEIKIPSLPTKFYLVVSRLTQYKRTELVVDLFNELTTKNLIVLGKGKQLTYLKSIAKKNITFLSDVSDEQLVNLYKNAEAVIMPQEEDFGYVAIEAQFFGCPIIALKKGGAVETIVEQKTGIFFDSQTKSSLSKALERYERISYNLKVETEQYGKKNALKFEIKKFTNFFKTV